ncbi:MAG: hypothetical protein JW830_12020 [Bacteroidales bacterium]|nr:hypothetical protein [Bacteroidales bacterium]
MEEIEVIKERLKWIKPELYILNFKDTSSGQISHPTLEGEGYTATQEGS